jgi:phosphopantothenoylcysteine decarboxylase/phosphopantothenate--cysteine ligase
VLAGRKIVVSAGGTREPIDPVRYVSNHSSGRQGYALAQAALDAGAREVVLISTVETLPVPVGSTVIAVDSAEQMCDAVLQSSADADALIMAAAVADFRPEIVAERKIKKTDDTAGMNLTLVRNPDILLEVKQQRARIDYPRVMVGFAAESDNLLSNAQSKLERKGLDMIVANDITAADAGFAVDTNRVVILDASGKHPQELMSKAEVAEAIVIRVAGILNNR